MTQSQPRLLLRTQKAKPRRSHFIGASVDKESKMAKVPDLFEDLKNCYSEDEVYSSEVDHISLNQKSFYHATYEPFHEKSMDNFMSLSTFEISKTSNHTFKESTLMVAASGKILKKRRFSLNQFLTDDDLEAIANDPEEEIIKPKSVSYNLKSNEKYNFQRTIKHQFNLIDALNQSIIQVHPYLSTAALQNMDDAVKFDMGSYTSNDDSKRPVTLRISETQLFVSTQNEDEPVMLKEVPKTPKIIQDETNLLFFWEVTGSKHYFRSVAHPTLFIATKPDKHVHLASGPPSITDLRIQDSVLT